jgi:hypothetical protein
LEREKLLGKLQTVVVVVGGVDTTTYTQKRSRESVETVPDGEDSSWRD